MAHQLTGNTIASTFEQLIYRSTTQPSTGTTTTQLMTSENDQTDDVGLPLYISTERIGIGSATPDALFHLEQATCTLASPHIRMVDTGDSREASIVNSSGDLILATHGTDNAADGQITIQSAGGILLSAGSDAATDVTIDTAGKVGIGTAAPDGTLHIKSSAEGPVADGGTAVAGLLVESTGTTTNLAGPTIALLNSSAAADGDVIGEIVFLGDDNVGDATGDTSVASTYGRIVSTIVDEDESGTSTDGALFFQLPVNDTVTTHMYMSGSKVGIGTTSPVSGLHVQDSDITLMCNVADNTTSTALEFKRSKHATDGSDDTAVDEDTVLGTVQWDGADGDSFETGAKIEAIADEQWSGSARGTSLNFYTVDNTNTALLPRMRIDENGNVGIGTNAPGDLLEVKSLTGSVCTISINTTDANQDSRLQFKHAGTLYWNFLSDYSDSHRLEIVDATGDGAYLTQNETSAWDWSSDINLKTDISSISNALSKINSIRGVNYKWKKYKAGASNPNPEYITSEEWAVMRPKKDINRIGVIAQEVNEVLPEAVNTERDGEWTVKRGLLVPLLIEAVKELSAKVTALEGEDSSSDTKIAALEAKDTASEAKIAALEAEDTANKAKITALETKDAEYATTITALTARITALESA